MRFAARDDLAEDETGELFTPFQWLAWGWGKAVLVVLPASLRSSDCKNWHLSGKRL